MKKVLTIVCGFALLVSVGCGPSKPKAVDVPPFDPGKIASKAMELYDKDKDGKLDEKELEACPGMLFSLKCPKSIDTNGDGKVDADEIKTRVQAWIEMKVGLSCPIVKFVDKKGKVVNDVVGKKVTLTPDAIHEGLKATTPIAIDPSGQCSPSTPDNLDNLAGMPYGFYTITIEGATNYKNLGVEIFDGAKADDVDSFQVELKK